LCEGLALPHLKNGDLGSCGALLYIKEVTMLEECLDMHLHLLESHDIHIFS